MWGGINEINGVIKARKQVTQCLCDLLQGGVSVNSREDRDEPLSKYWRPLGLSPGELGSRLSLKKCIHSVHKKVAESLLS